MSVTKWIVLLIALLCAVWLAASWYVSEQFLSLGIVDYEEVEELEILDGLKIPLLEKQAVSILSDGVSLSASFFEHPDPKGCAVVLLPGIGGYRTQVLPALPMFWDLGCHVIAYDPRGTGDSTRVPRTFGYLEKKDNAAVIRWVASHAGIDPSSIGVWGPSFGAAVGILTLDEIEELSFVIADSTFHSFEQVAYDTIAILSNTVVAAVLTPGVLNLLEFRTGMEVDMVKPEASIAGTLTPVLLIHAADDPAMNKSHSQIVFDAKTTDNVAIEITDWGAGHADSALIDPDAYRSLIFSFLSEQESTQWLINN